VTNLPYKDALYSYGLLNSEKKKLWVSFVMKITFQIVFVQRIFLGAFALSQKVPFSDVMSVRPSVLACIKRDRRSHIHRSGSL